MGRTGVIITIAVPRSGWFITIVVGINTKPMGIMIEVNFFILRLWSERYLARKSTVKTFANSLGWIEKLEPGILNQRYVPAWDEPVKGNKTIKIPITYNG